MGEHAWRVLREVKQSAELKEYLRTMTLVTAIISAGKMAAGADPGDALRTMLGDYRAFVFPEHSDGLQDRAKDIEKLLKREVAAGPMKVKALRYSKRERKKTP